MSRLIFGVSSNWSAKKFKPLFRLCTLLVKDNWLDRTTHSRSKQREEGKRSHKKTILVKTAKKVEKKCYTWTFVRRRRRRTWARKKKKDQKNKSRDCPSRCKHEPKGKNIPRLESTADLPMWSYVRIQINHRVLFLLQNYFCAHRDKL